MIVQRNRDEADSPGLRKIVPRRRRDRPDRDRIDFGWPVTPGISVPNTSRLSRVVSAASWRYPTAARAASRRSSPSARRRWSSRPRMRRDETLRRTRKGLIPRPINGGIDDVRLRAEIDRKESDRPAGVRNGCGPTARSPVDPTPCELKPLQTSAASRVFTMPGGPRSKA